ncbi:unnamed protein product [Hydatigera taeniaeformis]|uniref:Ig-like domain-containing protein n=1 Tax=Hydatigena taeniaeformis TaxID=6205 RepID=A0A0R3WJR6_HYDTA|nr:unnamed protein product [Hydatigera taeniaeformis]
MVLMPLIFFLVVQLVPSASLYRPLQGDIRVVKGQQNAPFNYATSLPGKYLYLVSGIHNVTLENGHCSTPFFTCTYNEVDSTQTNVKMTGYMSYGLKWVTFMGASNQVPIAVVFFTDDVWNDLGAGSIQPQYSVPLIVRAHGLPSVTLTCSIFASNPKYNLYTGVDNVLYYSAKPAKDETKEHKQILNLEARNILMHKVITLTVKKKFDIDFYSCNVGDHWLTHTIDWIARLLNTVWRLTPAPTMSCIASLQLSFSSVRCEKSKEEADWNKAIKLRRFRKRSWPNLSFGLRHTASVPCYQEDASKDIAAIIPQTRPGKSRSKSMTLLQVALFLVALTVTDCAGTYTTLPGDTRIVKARESEAFNYKTTLPDYTDMMTVTLRGKMSSKLKWATFRGPQDLVPITVLFFVNNIWNDSTAAKTEDNKTVELVNRHVTFQVTLYTGEKMQKYYQLRLVGKPFDKTAQYEQMLNLEVRNILLHKVLTLTVKQKDAIDFYTCKVGDKYLTHTIDWTSTASKWIE